MELRTKRFAYWKTAFLSTLLMGLLIHMPALLSDIPNHDGLDSMYFDQNMITSGRWFLTVACGFSSYYTIPWVIGILGLVFLACTGVALVELLGLEDKLLIISISGLLAAFPALSSTFAYVFTLDGYMLAMFLAVLSVLLVKKYRYGFWPGALCLACSMGTYQAYLSFAVILSIYMLVLLVMEKGAWKDKIKQGLRYLYMGVLGCILYFVILQLLLWIQGKKLADYQGISSMGNAAGRGVLESIRRMYEDFVSFFVAGHIVFNNIFSVAAVMLLAIGVCVTILFLCRRRKWWKKPEFFVIIGLLVVALPVATNLILLISPDVTYHLLMRYQWVLYPILMLDFVHRFISEEKTAGWKAGASGWFLKTCVAAALILVFNYAVTDNIAYSNLQKRYEKTYAYCIRLLDRIEQTEGYYPSIPIAMIGVVGDEQFPVTDITGEITGNMIGMSGDSLLYTGANYQAFMKHYLGATLNFLEPEVMKDIYYSKEYMEMDSFPGPDSVKVVNGILYVKTENQSRE